MDNNKSTNKGIGFTGLLTLVFIVLKLCGVVTWSWWWVLSPIWISIGVCAMLLIIMFFIVKKTATKINELVDAVNELRKANSNAE